MQRAALVLILLGCGAAPPTHPSDNFVPSELALSYEAWVEANGLLHAPAARWIEAAAPLVGTRVRWPLASWQGEGTFGEPFGAPNGWTGRYRTRFASRGLADLAAVEAAGTAFVYCPGLLDLPETKDVIVDGIFLGVSERGGGTEVWLVECAVHP